METQEAGVYSIRSNTSSKVYVGSALSVPRRFGEHLRMLKRNDHENVHLQRAWNRYGESDFIFSIECFCEPSMLIEKEQIFIDKYRTELGWRKMYNMNPKANSCFGRRHTKASLAKMSSQQRGAGNGFYGKKHSPETIKKLQESHKGQIPANKGVPHTEETKKKIALALTGKTAWNKGLTKETDIRIREYAKGKLGKNIWANREHPRAMLGKTHSSEVRAKISFAMKISSSNRERNDKGQFSA